MRLIWGGELLRKRNLHPFFLFIMYDVYVATVSSLNVKLCLCFEKFYIFLSLIAVKKKTLRIRRLSTMHDTLQTTFIQCLKNSMNITQHKHCTTKASWLMKTETILFIVIIIQNTILCGRNAGFQGTAGGT